MLVYKPGTPEAQLSDLLDLAERLSHTDRSLFTGPCADVMEEAARAVSARIRAVSAEMVKAPIAQPEVRPFKVGDQVRVVRHVGEPSRLSRCVVGVKGTLLEHNVIGESEDIRRRCWAVSGEEGEYGWHSDEELEHADGP